MLGPIGCELRSFSFLRPILALRYLSISLTLMAHIIWSAREPSRLRNISQYSLGHSPHSSQHHCDCEGAIAAFLLASKQNHVFQNRMVKPAQVCLDSKSWPIVDNIPCNYVQPTCTIPEQLQAHPRYSI